jgi:hypothetical protein
LSYLTDASPPGKEGIKMKNMTKALREIVLPFVLAQGIIVGVFAGWTCLWIV